MPQTHNAYIGKVRTLIESRLESLLPLGDSPAASRMNEAIRYAVFPGGKRTRPLLSVAAARAAGGSVVDALDAACAVEFLHTSSLIFDDLPCMDDAECRRASPALHRAFGEPAAILAALALLNRAYAIFGSSGRLIAEAASAIGMNGMIAGQAVDLHIRRADAAGQFDARIQKTSALMRLTLTSGAIACGASPADVRALAYCGEMLGEAYQIRDDLLDGFPCEVTGKTGRQDARHFRPTALAEYGEEESARRVRVLIVDAQAAIEERFGANGPARDLLHMIEAAVASLLDRQLVMA